MKSIFCAAMFVQLFCALTLSDAFTTIVPLAKRHTDGRLFLSNQPQEQVDAHNQELPVVIHTGMTKDEFEGVMEGVVAKLVSEFEDTKATFFDIVAILKDFKEILRLSRHLAREVAHLKRGTSLLEHRSADFIKQYFFQRSPELGERFDIRSFYDLSRIQLFYPSNKLAQYVYKNCTNKLFNLLTEQEFGTDDSEYRRAYPILLSLKEEMEKKKDEDDENLEDHEWDKLGILTDLIELLNASGADKEQQEELNHNDAIDYLLMRSNYLLVPLILASDRFASLPTESRLCSELKMNGFREYKPRNLDFVYGFGITLIEPVDKKEKAKDQFFLQAAFFDEAIKRVAPTNDYKKCFAGDEAILPVHINFCAAFYDLETRHGPLKKEPTDLMDEAGSRFGEIDCFDALYYREARAL